MRTSPFLSLFVMALVFGLPVPALADKMVLITSEPAGATIELNGKIIGNTPHQEKLKDFWFTGPKFVWNQFLNVPLQITVRKDGYIPQTITLTAGPYRWVNLNYTVEKIYYVITRTSFSVNLQKTPQPVESTPPVVIAVPDKNSLANSLSFAAAGTFRLDELSANAKLSTSRPELVIGAGHTSRVNTIVFSPDEKVLASGDSQGVVKLWNIKNGMGLRTLGDENELTQIQSLTFSPDGKVLASAMVERHEDAGGAITWKTGIKFWDVVSGRVLKTFAGYSSAVRSIAFSPDGRLLASGSVDKKVSLWDVETGKIIKTFTGHAGEVNTVLFTPDGSSLLSGSWSTAIKFWNITNGVVLQEIPGNPAFQPPSIFDAAGVLQPIKTAFNLATSNLVFAPTESIYLLKLGGNGTQVLKEFRSSKTVDAVALSQSGKVLASATWSDIKLWDINSASEILTIKGGKNTDVIAMSPDSHFIALNDGDGGKSIKLWDTNKEATLKILAGHSEEIICLTFSLDSKLLASGSDDKMIKLWDVESGKVKTLKGHTNSVGAVAFSPNGAVLASIAYNIGEENDGDELDKAVRLWDVASGKELRRLTVSPSSLPLSISYSPSGKTLAIGNNNRTISLLDVASGKVFKTLTGNFKGVVSVIFVNEDLLQSLSMHDEDDYVGERTIWSVSSGKLVNNVKVDALGLTGNAPIFLGGIPALATSKKVYSLPMQNSGIRFYSVPLDRLADPTSQTELASLYLFGDSDWLVTTPEGFFDGSPAAWEHAFWRFNNSTFDSGAVELYFNDFYHPNLLQSVFAGKSPQSPAGRELEKIDRRQPKVEITVNDGQVITDKRLAAITIEVTDNLDRPKQPSQAVSSGAADLRLFRNGSLVRVWPGDIFALAAKDGCEQLLPAKSGEPRRARCRAEAPVVAGANQFSAYAFNREKVKSGDSQFTVKGADTLKRSRTLYVLAIGVSQYENPAYNLSYTAKDARDFGLEVSRHQAQVGYYQKVEIIPLIDQAAKKADVFSMLKRLAGMVQPEDGVIVFFSGHGTAQGDHFYLIPHDIGYNGASSQVRASLQTVLAHSISDLELEVAFRDIDAERFLFIIDSCNSGKALQADDWRRGPMNTKGLGQLAYEKGMSVLTASQDVELAYESAALKHSYLTYALVEEGLRIKVRDADANGDGQVLLKEWLGYATQRVPHLRQGKVEQTARQQNKSLEEIEIIEQGKMQQPKVFNRREPELNPFVVAKTEIAQPKAITQTVTVSKPATPNRPNKRKPLR